VGVLYLFCKTQFDFPLCVHSAFARNYLTMPVHLEFEFRAHSEGYRFIAGVDEVGRGCIAGPVVAGAVIWDLSKPVPEGLDDSKKLTKKKREELTEEIKQNAITFAIAESSVEDIERINILEASKKAMELAIESLSIKPDHLLIDALELKAIKLPQKAIIHGDAVSASIAAASVIAKTYRDELMTALDSIYPQYGFGSHKGYGTKAHFDAIKVHGPCDAHRKSFRGVMQQELF
jgi:ribonuclease HII